MESYLYQYCLGGLIFGAGLVYAWRQGYVAFHGRGLKTLLLCVLGLMAFAAVQGYLQFAPMTEAAPVAFTGDYTETHRIGTPLDYGIMIGYFVVILAIGTWYGRRQQTTKDFFFGGQRFAWWLITFSLMATTVGSYSFVKYSSIAYTYGVASTQTYLNDWFWLPLFAFGWLPILYFSRVTSIPEYFERRFGPGARRLVTTLLLVYLVGYVGVNLFTMGKALNVLLGWDIRLSALVVAAISAVYVTSGGQTSVIMTDLFQGVMLIATGLLVLFLGAEQLGGLGEFWHHLPRGHRTAFASFNADPAYNSGGIFWQDCVANSAMFFFLNQGFAMRFMAARSVDDARRATIAVMLVLMPLGAIVVASGGWVGRALVHAGVLPEGIPSERIFFVTAELLAQPGVFGLVMASLTAALMSTVDTLITAIAAIVVNDIYRPRRPQASERELLAAARWSSVGVTLLGVALVPAFMVFSSIYQAHGAFTAAVTPPLVVALLLGVFWRRFHDRAAIWTLAGGGVAMLASIVWPVLVSPFSLGVPAEPLGEGLLAGAKVYTFTRAFYGIVVCSVIGVGATLFTRPGAERDLRGLVWGTVKDAIARYKGTPGAEGAGPWASATPLPGPERARRGAAEVLPTRVSPALADSLGGVVPGDLLYVTDRRLWLGGLRSTHLIVDGFTEPRPDAALELAPDAWEAVVAPRRRHTPLRVRRLYSSEPVG
ncbi:MAG: sodium/solute symporter [Deltaproteobacteria bacterium]|nr:sodium/solute symporter [Deltaproteobacteria bacterium]